MSIHFRTAAAAALTLCILLSASAASAATIAIPPLRDVDFISAQTGFAVGQERVLVTADGGATWYAPNIPAGTSLLRGVAFASPTLGVVVGESGSVLRTTDGGKTWTKYATSNTDRLDAVAWVDATTAVAVGSGYNSAAGKTTGVAWRSTDAGVSWSRFFLADMPRLDSVAFSGQNGVTGGYNWTARTTNGGSTWTKNPQQTWGWNYDLLYANGKLWNAGGSNNMTGRIGFNWTTDDFATDDYTGWVETGAVGRIIKMAIIGNAGWAAGNSGATDGWSGSAVVLKSSDSGASWTAVNTPAVATDGCIDGTSGSHAVFGGATATQRALFRTTDGGATWIPVTAATVGFPGGTTDPGGTNPPPSTRPHVQLTTPTLSLSTPRKGKAFTISGRATPKHSGSVKLYVWRKVGSSWKPYKTYTAGLTQKATYSSYAYRLSLPYSGYWYVKAGSFGQGELLPGMSKTRYFTVKK